LIQDAFSLKRTDHSWHCDQLAMARIPLLSLLLLPAFSSCDEAPATNLRGAIPSVPQASSITNTSQADELDEIGATLNGTMLLPSVGTRNCWTTHNANQCLMARAKKANKAWGDWTQYVNSDRYLTGTSSLKTDCSGFVSWALKGCITLDEKVLRGIERSGPSHRTRAMNFYDAFGENPPIASSGKWCRVPDFRDVKRGDILVYDIPDNRGRPGKDTGHIMIAYRSPIEVGKTRDGKLVFAQKVIDSSHRPHFDFGTFHDTRERCTNEKCGAGVGYVYVFTNASGKILAIRLRGDDDDRNAKKCYVTSRNGKRKKIGCFSQSNNRRHRYRIGRLRA